MTGRDYIKRALGLLNAYTVEEGLDPNDSTVCFEMLNAMLDSWSSDIGAIYAETQESFTMTASQVEHTMGATGDFVTTKPIELVKVMIRDSSDIDHEVKLIPNREYQEIVQKDSSDSLPLFCGYNMEHPDISLKFYPAPDTAYSCRITSFKPLTAATMSGAYSAPKGYDLAIIYNLAVVVAPMFGASNMLGLAADPTSLAGRAIKLYQNLCANNFEPMTIGLDPIFPNRDNVVPRSEYR